MTTDSAISNTDSEMYAELEAGEDVNLDEEVAEDRVRTTEPDTQDRDACWTGRGRSELLHMLLNFV